MTPIRIGSLFSGIGGLDLGIGQALEHNGIPHTTQWMVEAEPFCQQVLAKHWPEAEIYSDVRTITEEVAPIDILVGGFPCQDLSVAGARAGLEGQKSGLFWEMHRIAVQLRPRIVVMENVAGIASIDGAVQTVCGAFSQAGYDLVWGMLRANDPSVGAPHRRERWFCVAYMADPEGQRAGRVAAREGRHISDAVGGSGCATGRTNGVADPDSLDTGGNTRTVRCTPRDMQAAGQAHRQASVCGGAATPKGVADPDCCAGYKRAEEQGREQEERAPAHRDGHEDLADTPCLRPQGGGAVTKQYESRQRAWGDSAAESADGSEAAAAEPADRRGGGEHDVHEHAAGCRPCAAKGEAECLLGGDPDGLSAGVDITEHRWPAPPGPYQYVWEPPRSIQSIDPDRRKRLKALGNAVVPQQAYVIGQWVVRNLIELADS